MGCLRCLTKAGKILRWLTTAQREQLLHQQILDVVRSVDVTVPEHLKVGAPQDSINLLHRPLLLLLVEGLNGSIDALGADDTPHRSATCGIRPPLAARYVCVWASRFGNVKRGWMVGCM